MLLEPLLRLRLCLRLSLRLRLRLSLRLSVCLCLRLRLLRLLVRMHHLHLLLLMLDHHLLLLLLWSGRCSWSAVLAGIRIRRRHRRPLVMVQTRPVLLDKPLLPSARSPFPSLQHSSPSQTATYALLVRHGADVSSLQSEGLRRRVHNLRVDLPETKRRVHLVRGGLHLLILYRLELFARYGRSVLALRHGHVHRRRLLLRASTSHLALTLPRLPGLAGLLLTGLSLTLHLRRLLTLSRRSLALLLTGLGVLLLLLLLVLLVLLLCLLLLLLLILHQRMLRALLHRLRLRLGVQHLLLMLRRHRCG